MSYNYHDDIRDIRTAIESNNVSLRDQFAMAALTGLLAKFGRTFDTCESAYFVADQMMIERNKNR